jgi:pimeloyl-ACP methyl ester carboxylesterase
MSIKSRPFAIMCTILALLSLALVSCLGPKETPITVPAGAQAGDLMGLEPCTYKAGGAEYAADCGTLVVPENRADPNSRLIALPVIRVRATGSNPTEPIFWFQGGPGLSNMKLSRVFWFIENHDIVLVGYRGVDGPVVLNCPEVVEVMRGAGRDDFLGDLMLDQSSAAYARCAERLQNEGVDIAGYTVAELIDDMEAARIGLDYQRINLLSGSFGTNVARIYAYMYPESIYRSAMLSVDTPAATIHEPQVVDEQIEYYADLCAQDPECSPRTDDLAETMRDVSHNMPKRWLFLPINAGLVKAATYNFFDLTTEAPMIIDVWLSAAEGDPSGMAALTLVGPSLFAKASVWGHNAALRASLGQFDLARDYRAELNPPDSIFGSPATTAAYAEYTAWPAALIPEAYRQVQPSDVETLLVSGSIDFNTPARFARDELLPSLSNGRQVIVSESGHVADLVTLQPVALKRLLTSFYDTGLADVSLFTYHPVDFHVGLGYPEQAKLGLAAIVLVFVIVVSLVWFVARLVRRRRVSQVSS